MLIVTEASAQGIEDLKLAFKAEQYEKATTMLKGMLKNDQYGGDAQYYLGSIYSKLNYIDSAESIFTKGTVNYRKNPLNFIGLAELALNSGNATKAKEYFDKGIKVTGRRDIEPYLYISRAYMQVEKPDLKSAFMALKKADDIDRKDNTAEVYLGYGDYYRLQKDSLNAIKNYRQALFLDPSLLEAKVQMANVYAQSGDFDKAEVLLKSITIQSPSYGPAFRTLSALHQSWPSNKKSNMDHATLSAEYYKHYLNITGGFYELETTYAELLFKAQDYGKLQTELKSLQRFKNQKKGGLVTRLNAYTAFENKDYTQALIYFDDYITTVADRSSILSTDYLYLGRTQLQLGQEQKAIYNISKAVEMDSVNTPYFAEIGRYYYDKKNWSNAIAYYKRINGVNKAEQWAENNLYYGTSLFFKYINDRDKGIVSSKELLLEAENLFSAIIQYNAQDANALLWHARTLYLLNESEVNTETMVDSYEKYIRIQEASMEPQSVALRKSMIESYNVLANYQFSKNQNDKARIYWAKSLALEPGNSIALNGIKLLNNKNRR